MLPIPDIDEVTELEGTSHHEEYDGGFQINCLFMHKKVDEVLNINVAFIINEQSIITLADDEVPELRLLRNRIKKGLKTSTKPKNIFLDLLESVDSQQSFETINFDNTTRNYVLIEKARGQYT